jgi:Cu(I)/Ag(I) efflux system membrane protein CusA/SilA
MDVLLQCPAKPPKMMTVLAIIASLLPVMYVQTIGTDVMKHIATPLIGGMVTVPILSLIIIPVVYLWWQEKKILGQKV